MPSTQPLMPGSRRYEEREWLHAQSEEWWADVLDRIACGVSPKVIALEYAVRYGMLMRVLEERPELKAEFERALEICSDGFAFDTIEIADGSPTRLEDGTVVFTDPQRDKLKIDTRWKAAGKWYRAKYGETVKHEIAGTVKIDAGLVVSMGELLERAATGRLIEHAPVQTLTHEPQIVPSYEPI